VTISTSPSGGAHSSKKGVICPDAGIPLLQTGVEVDEPAVVIKKCCSHWI
jgi:hypothetical protein